MSLPMHLLKNDRNPESCFHQYLEKLKDVRLQIHSFSKGSWDILRVQFGKEQIVDLINFDIKAVHFRNIKTKFNQKVN